MILTKEQTDRAIALELLRDVTKIVVQRIQPIYLSTEEVWLLNRVYEFIKVNETK